MTLLCWIRQSLPRTRTAADAFPVLLLTVDRSLKYTSRITQFIYCMSGILNQKKTQKNNTFNPIVGDHHVASSYTKRPWVAGLSSVEI